MNENKASYDKKNKIVRKNEKYLTFEALEDECPITLQKIGNPTTITMRYSIDGGLSWLPYTLGTKIYINRGQTIKFYSISTSLSANTSSYYQFVIPKKMDVYGGLLSLRNFTTGLGNYVFYRLFYNANIVRAEELNMPFTSIVNYCYYKMFENCSELISAPELPATILSTYCYGYMFLNCTSLTIPPVLPSPKMVAANAYEGMFSGCSSLNNITLYCLNTFSFDNCFNSWLKNVAPTGTIYKPAVLNLPSSAIPSGWTAVDIPSETLTFQNVNETHQISDFNDVTSFTTNNKPSFLKISNTGEVTIKGKLSKSSTVFYIAIRKSGQPLEYRLIEFLYLENCLKFTATQANSSIGLGVPDTKWNLNSKIYYSTDNGFTWTEYASPSNTDYATCPMISLPNVGDSVMFRGTNRVFNSSAKNYMSFKMTGKISASGNLFSLIGFYEGNAPSYAFYHLFADCDSLVQAPEMNSLAVNSYCYRGMFLNCTSLTEPPLLIATDIYAYCYAEMFYGCTGLTKAPILPAVNIREGSYYSMFEGCTALTEAPVLPATGVTTYSYYRMFAGCTSLVNARSIIHATSLAGSYGFKEMFYGCTSLVKAPRIISSTFGTGYCQRMFYGCSLLNWVMISSNAWRDDATTEWLEGVSPTGTFRCSSLWLPIVRGSSNIPAGWKLRIVNCAQEINADYIDYLDLKKYLTITATTLNKVTMDTITITSDNLPSSLTLTNGVLEGEITEDKSFTVTATTLVNSWKVPVTLHRVNYTDALKFTATQANSKIRLIKVNSPTAITCLYSLDNGSTWANYAVTSSSATITLPNIGDTVMFRCTTRTFSTNTSHYYRFYMDAGGFTASGHLSSLCNFHDACTNNYQFVNLFYSCTRLHEATIRLHSALINYCYYSLFYGCTNLTVVPELYTIDVKPYCYQQMFYGCSSLVTAPTLPADILAEGCYNSMFYNCSSLVNPPELPALVLGNYCYRQMFLNCTSLVTPPALPGTYLSAYCYYYMFYGCSSLTSCPELPAMTMASYCYSYMFVDCTSLVNVPDLPATTYSASHRAMFYGCTSLKCVRSMMYNTFSDSNTQVFLCGCGDNGKLVLLHPFATPLFNDSIGIPFNWYCEDAKGNLLGMGASDIAEIGLLPGETINYQLKCGNPEGHTVVFEGVNVPEGVTVSSTGLITGNCATDESFSVNIKLDGELQKISKVFINHAIVENCLKLTNVHTTTSTVRIQRNNRCRPIRLQYSLNDGETWASFVYGTNVTIPKDRSILIRNLDDFFNHNYDISYQFVIGGNLEASGDISSLVNFSKNINYPYEFTKVFMSCAQLSSVENLILPYMSLGYSTYYASFYGCTNITTPPQLPATKMGESCYNSMFQSCTKLTRTPTLPAMQLAPSCYQTMFYGCTKLTDVTALPATELKSSCYYNMFYNCTSLVNAPALPATIIPNAAYQYMFYGCKSLVEPPDLPARQFTNTYCYQYMFCGCTSLARMPELPATASTSYCYQGMFQNCTSLTETTWLPMASPSYAYRYMFNGCTNLSLIRCNTKTLTETNCIDWVKNVAPNGVFVKNPELVDSFEPYYAIPAGWTIKNAVVAGNNSFTQPLEASTITLNCTCASSPLVFSSDDIPSALSLNASNGTITNVSAVENHQYSFHVTATPTDTDIPSVTFTVYVMYRADILRFSATKANSSIGLGAYSSTFTCDNHFYYSLDEGVTWTEYASPSSKKYTACEMINVPNGGSILFRGITNNLGYGDGTNFSFRMTGEFEVSGNIMSLINFEEDIPSEYCFARLFYNCQSLVSIENLSLPAMRLMPRCYYAMFYNVNKAVTPPQLPATELADYCYWCIFESCTSLKTAPALPATNLKAGCYRSMFYKCTSLETVVELKGTTLYSECYQTIFYNCNKLKGIIVHFNSWTSATNATVNWVSGITNNTGTFTIKSAILPIERGVNRIPSNWTVNRIS